MLDTLVVQALNNRNRLSSISSMPLLYPLKEISLGQFYSQSRNDGLWQVWTFTFIISQLGESNNNIKKENTLSDSAREILRAYSCWFFVLCVFSNKSLCECLLTDMTQYKLLNKSFKRTRTVISSQKNKSKTKNLVINEDKYNLFMCVIIKKARLLLSI